MLEFLAFGPISNHRFETTVCKPSAFFNQQLEPVLDHFNQVWAVFCQRHAEFFDTVKAGEFRFWPIPILSKFLLIFAKETPSSLVPERSKQFIFGMRLFAYSWKLPACSGAFVLTVVLGSFLLTIGAFFAYSCSLFAVI